MAHFYPPGLLLLVLLIVILECRDGSSVIKTVVASPEEDVFLPCFDSNVEEPKSCSRVKLIKYATDASQMRVILARPETPKFQDANRVKWEADENGQMSVFLTKSQKTDEGLYGCEIWRGWDCVLVKNISLKVKDCKTLRAVKAAPSTPVNLTCPVDVTSRLQGPQNISWATLKGGKPVSVKSNRVEMNGTSLAIQSVNYSDSGWYRCQYVLGQSQRCFEINLRVQVEDVVATTLPEEDVLATTVPALRAAGRTTTEIITETRKEGSSGAFIAIVVSSVVIGIAIMAAVIGLFISRRRNTQRVPHLTHRHPEGTLVDSTGGYEIVDLTASEDRTTRVNSLYQQFPDESLCTFQL